MQCITSLIRGSSIGFAMLAATLAAAEEGPRLAQAEESPAEDVERVEPRRQRETPELDPEIEEIVILGTTTDASEDYSVADSITGFGADDLAALGAQDIADLASFTPNLEIVTAGATTPTFFIRGVGLNDFNPNSTGAVAVYQDDVAINAPAMQLGTLFDVQTVNVLRGPQGIGLARNASAGAIKIYARKPTGDFGGFLRSDFGNYGYMDYEGAFETPLYQDMLSTRLAFRLSQRDGTMKNRCAGAPSFERRLTDTNGDGTGDFQIPLNQFGFPFFPTGTSQTQGPWSICGEAVTRGLQSADPFVSLGISSVPPGLEENVNDINNWAARGTLLFQPTLDMEWLLNAHGSRRDEISRLGQAIGTAGKYCPESVNFADCIRFPNPGQQNGLLGGSQANQAGRPTSNPNDGYVPVEIRERYDRISPCLNDPSLNCNALPIAVDSEPWEGDFSRTGPTTNDTWGTYLKGEILLPREVDFTTTSAFDTYDRLTDVDLDFSPQTLFEIETDDKGWQFYQDLKFSGQVDWRNPLTWEVGGWFLREVLEARVENTLSPLLQTGGVRSRDYKQTLWSAAGYGSFSMDFWDDFTVDGGVRFNWEQKDLDMEIVGGQAGTTDSCPIRSGEMLFCQVDASWSAPTGTIRLTYRFRDDTHVYAKYSRGWKPGTFNATASQFTGPSIAEPESLDSFETGLRGSWWDGRIGIDMSLFYYAYTNYQIFTAQQLSGSPPQFLVLNANDAEVYGSEVDAQGRPDFVQRDQFLRSGAGSQVAFRERQSSGNPLLNSPRFKVSMTAEQTVRLADYGSLTLRYDGVWTDTTFYDSTAGRGQGDEFGEQFLPEDTIAQGPYWLHNLRLSWRAPNERIEVAGWVRNIENTPYKTFAFDGSNFQATTIYFVGDPRTYGISLIFNF
jgi:outer membrane receptor protein involved in Fe transport